MLVEDSDPLLSKKLFETISGWLEFKSSINRRYTIIKHCEANNK